jgi:TolB protein
VFFSSREGGLDIWRIELADGRLTQLTHGEGLNLNPFFSPDGTFIAFQSDRDGALEVWLMDADGSRPRQLTTVGVIGHFLRWSRDGRWIYFRCPRGAKPGVLRVRAEGGDPESAGDIAGGSHLSLSPDGSLLMDVLNHKTLWVSTIDGGAPRKVFEFDDSDSRIDYPVWSPDGRWILFDRFVPHGGDIWTITLQ